ncbi:MAG: glycyl-radical enzyme activating protein [Anaerolineales bacterium]|nr:glycyl-radical enzyme activating protein [Anaerolineales bacterium]
MDGNRKQGGEAGWVFNIQRYAVHDGPGIRTTVFLKGCPLHCLWCDNPESQPVEPQLVFWEDRCIHCGTCLAVCPLSAVLEDSQGRKQIDPKLCDLCGLCVDQCYAGALEQLGRLRTVGEVLTIVEEDRPFYDESGGGMTLSGGEPLTQPQFTYGLLKGAKARGIQTAIETSGFAPWPVWKNLLPYLDLILYDLKETDPKQHEYFTGVSNELVLDNLRRLTKANKPVIVRRPVIPGYNDTPESIHALGRFVRELETVSEIDLLPYHRLGQNKYKQLGQEYLMDDMPTMKDEEVTGLRDILLSYGLNVKIGG